MAEAQEQRVTMCKSASQITCYLIPLARIKTIMNLIVLERSCVTSRLMQQ